MSKKNRSYYARIQTGSVGVTSTAQIVRDHPGGSLWLLSLM
ncbi:MAG TPA: hypothetical protein VHO84_09060 [Syntrophorhabdaceae bacterium]|nr:hypothetical protein [Syntrophorhabdaceae bacterium]